MDQDSGVSEISSDVSVLPQNSVTETGSQTSDGEIASPAVSEEDSTSDVADETDQVPVENLCSVFETLSADYSFTAVTLMEELRTQRQDLTMYYENIFKLQEEKWQIIAAELETQILDLQADNQHMQTSLSYREMKTCQCCHSDVILPSMKNCGTQTNWTDMFLPVHNGLDAKAVEKARAIRKAFRSTTTQKPQEGNNIFSSDKISLFRPHPNFKSVIGDMGSMAEQKAKSDFVPVSIQEAKTTLCVNSKTSSTMTARSGMKSKPDTNCKDSGSEPNIFWEWNLSNALKNVKLLTDRKTIPKSNGENGGASRSDTECQPFVPNTGKDVDIATVKIKGDDRPFENVKHHILKIVM